MSITLTYTFATAQELAAHINGTGRHTQQAAPVTLVTPEKKPVAEPAPSPSGATPQTTVQEAPAPEKASGSEKALTLDDAKALTMKLVSAKGRDTAKGLLDKFSVPVAAKLAPEQVADFCRQAEELLK